MSDYYYATKEEASPYKEKIMEIIGRVYDDLTDKYSDFDFDYGFSGPSKVNMVTYDDDDRYGYEFDVDLIMETDDDLAETIVDKFYQAFNKYRYRHNYTPKKGKEELYLFSNDDKFTCCLYFVVNKVSKSCDRYRYICYDDNSRCYEWVNSSNKYDHISEEIKWLKTQKLWANLRDEYLNVQDNCEESVSPKELFMDTVHKMAVKNGIYKKPKNTESKNDNKSKKEIHQFEYVTRKEAGKVKEKLDEIINQLHKELKSTFTFQPRYVGSSSRNMITRDIKGNVGYDFDVDIIPNLNGKKLKPKQIRDAFRNALDNCSTKYGFSYACDSTSVITIKVVDRSNSKIKYSCDFAIVRMDDNNVKQFIRCNKEKTPHTYTWEYRGGGQDDISVKYEWIKKNNFTDDLKKLYLKMKNENYCEDKHSRSIFAESVNIICDRNKYKKRKK